MDDVFIFGKVKNNCEIKDLIAPQSPPVQRSLGDVITDHNNANWLTSYKGNLSMCSVNKAELWGQEIGYKMIIKCDNVTVVGLVNGDRFLPCLWFERIGTSTKYVFHEPENSSLN